MEYGDTIAYELSDGEEKKTLHLTYNANTYLIYKRFFDSDLMGDILKATSNNSPLPKDIQDKIASGELTMDNLNKANLDSVQGSMIDTTFILQAVIAMVATYERSTGKRHSVDEIADSLPASLPMDADFMEILTEFLLFGLKKTEAANKRLSSVMVRRK